MRRKNRRGGITVFLLLAILAAVALLLWWRWDRMLPGLCKPLVEQRQAECTKEIETLKAKLPKPEPRNTSAHLEVDEFSIIGQRWAQLTGTPPVWPQDFPFIRDCDTARGDLLALCHELDSRLYLQGRIQTGGCFTLITQAMETLAAHPPVASGELLRYETVLANVFHLFRVLGKDRMNLFREMLSREEVLAEPIAMTLFDWLITRDRCGEENPKIGFQVLYDYAAFFLNTVGGQVYLRRRSPKIAGLASFYALVVLDQALKRGINPHGVDIRPHIPRCLELLDRPDLLFKDQYHRILRQMEAQWGPPSGPPWS